MKTLIITALIAMLLAGCEKPPCQENPMFYLKGTVHDCAVERAPKTHNERGGYIDACGDQPGLVGDDC
jgi:hypothetical protein